MEQKKELEKEVSELQKKLDLEIRVGFSSHCCIKAKQENMKHSSTLACFLKRTSPSRRPSGLVVVLGSRLMWGASTMLTHLSPLLLLSELEKGEGDRVEEEV